MRFWPWAKRTNGNQYQNQKAKRTNSENLIRKSIPHNWFFMHSLWLLGFITDPLFSSLMPSYLSCIVISSTLFSRARPFFKYKKIHWSYDTRQIKENNLFYFLGNILHISDNARHHKSLISNYVITHKPPTTTYITPSPFLITFSATKWMDTDTGGTQDLTRKL